MTTRARDAGGTRDRRSRSGRPEAAEIVASSTTNGRLRARAVLRADLPLLPVRQGEGRPRPGAQVLRRAPQRDRRVRRRARRRPSRTLHLPLRRGRDAYPPHGRAGGSHRAIPVSGERAVEVLPTHATEGLDRLAGMGVTSVSIGAQSFHDEVLRRLRRPHDATSRSAVERSLGRFGCVDVDLIVDVAWDDRRSFLDDVRTCFTLGVDQVSTYPLMRFGYTPFGAARHDRRREHTVLAEVTASPTRWATSGARSGRSTDATLPPTRRSPGVGTWAWEPGPRRSRDATST